MDALLTRRLSRIVTIASVCWPALLAPLVLMHSAALAQVKQPIAFTGHGAFFDSEGQQIALSQSFVAQAQEWYRARLTEGLTEAQKKSFAVFELRLKSGLSVDGQDQLLLQHHALEWLLAQRSKADSALEPHTANILRALRHTLHWKLPLQGDLRVQEKREVFEANPDVLKRLDQSRITPKGGLQARTATANSGQAYLNECMAAGVPVPPPINMMDPAGLTGWKSQGFIPQAQQFIVGSPAEVRTFRSAAPEGLCIALPRYSDATLNTASLDGVICMGKQSSKVCFWDNQWTTGGVVQTFPIPAGTQIPIGVPSTPGGKYQAGGKEIEFGPGGVCTDCHAGENPYIIHPLSNLATSGPSVLWQSLSGAPQNLATMGVNRYDPLVGASWPQNQLSQANPNAPNQCTACHVKGVAGRFPHLSNKLPGYCSTVLAQAGVKTMPPGAEGSSAAAVAAFRNAWCNQPPVASSGDAGDPHIRTTNGVHYDFQAAGEFTVLRNSDTDFELQTRQIPVLTNFIPGANAYTGLSSCVSLNTAVALRVGKHHISYQPAGGTLNSREKLVLQVNGKVVRPGLGINLGDGNRIVKGVTVGDLDLRLADGSRVVVMPLFWASQGYWYLDVQVFDTPAREGVMGPILGGDWLPRAPDGSSFGPQPAALFDRHVLLNQKFADAWRVQAANSLFTYASGTSTADFTDRNWPAAPGDSCDKTALRMSVPQVKEPRADLAERACSAIRDKRVRENCLFDVTVMGDVAAARGHLKADKLMATHRPAAATPVP